MYGKTLAFKLGTTRLGRVSCIVHRIRVADLLNHGARAPVRAVALSATLFRVKIELSDVDRGVYESLDLRVAQHPSEDATRVVARLLAYALLYEEGLEFGRGLSDVDEPSLAVHDLTGKLVHWIDVGTPSAERIHLANKKADRVTIACHKGQEALAREMANRKIFGADKINVLYLDQELVAQLASALERNADWIVVHNDGELSVTIADTTCSGSVTRSGLPV